MADSPTRRSLVWCRDNGLVAGVVEKWNPHAKIRQDLFGWIDLIVLDGHVTIGVQATSTSNMAAREHKIREDRAEALSAWLESPLRTAEVWGWAKRGPRGKRKVWTLKRTEIT